MTTPPLRRAPTFSLGARHGGVAELRRGVTPFERMPVGDDVALLWVLFPASGEGAAVDEVAASFARARGETLTAEVAATVHAIVARLQAVGALVPAGHDPSAYAAVTEDYAAARPVPAAVLDDVVRLAQLDGAARVLDLASGPGDLALAAARVSPHVTATDVSPGFLAVIEGRATSAGVPVATLEADFEALEHQGEHYDVILAGNAFDWARPWDLAALIVRLGRPGARLLVVDGIPELAPEHPLFHGAVGAQLKAGHDRRLTLDRRARYRALFEALSHGLGPAAKPDGEAYHTVARSFDASWVRAYVTDLHVLGALDDPTALRRFQEDLAARTAVAGEGALAGREHWSVVAFSLHGAA